LDFLSIVIIGFGLAMDAFAVSVTNGIVQKRSTFRHAFISALFFGGFQGIMPLIGWAFGYSFASQIGEFDHWVAFVLLVFIGFSMIMEAVKCKGNDGGYSSFSVKMLFLSAVATSIDALIVGVTFAVSGITFLNSILVGISVIALITFCLCMIGFYVGRGFGSFCRRGSQFFGGAILIIIGFKILIEHLFF